MEALSNGNSLTSCHVFAELFCKIGRPCVYGDATGKPSFLVCDTPLSQGLLL